MVLLCATYLTWGAIASLNDILIPYLKDEFSLDYTSALRVQLVFYAAYFFLSLPFGQLTRRLGYANSVLTGLLLAATGCLAMAAATRAGVYGAFLSALFLLASGITLLQVSANPFVTTMGNPATGPSRLTLAQSFHSLGMTVGPWFGSILVFGAAGLAVSRSGTHIPGQALLTPYLLLATALVVIAIAFRHQVTGQPSVKPEGPSTSPLALIRRKPALLLGTLGIFFYVGAEISIGSFLVNYLGESGTLGLSPAEAGPFVSVYWGLALTGRFVGAALLRRIPAVRMLVGYALTATTLVAVSVFSGGWLAVASILLVGFFNSIMFPTLFALIIGRHTENAQAVSGILCLGIVGGAVISQCQGALADMAGLRLSFILPAACYLYVAAYAYITATRR